MNQETIALVFMSDDKYSFFIENPPSGPPQKWIAPFVTDIEHVEYVEVYERGPRLQFWSNPNVCPES